MTLEVAYKIANYADGKSKSHHQLKSMISQTAISRTESCIINYAVTIVYACRNISSKIVCNTVITLWCIENAYQ
jgi:hypothetical protein